MFCIQRLLSLFKKAEGARALVKDLVPPRGEL